VSRREVRVAQRHAEILVSEKLLNRPDRQGVRPRSTQGPLFRTRERASPRLEVG
jgi:hypothetical protein